MTRAAVPSPHPTSFVQVPAGRRAVIDLAGAGTPVLLVPGYLGSKEDFTPVLDGIQAAGHRVIALDLAGQWESEGSDDQEAYRPEALAADLPHVLDALGIERAHLVGHSYGGLVSQAAVRADRERWASLVLLCSGAGAIQGERRNSIDLMRQLAGGMDLNELYDGLLAYWESHGEALPPPNALPFQRDRFTHGASAAIVGIAVGLLETPDGVDDLAKLVRDGFPVAVVYGENEDAWLPAEQKDMAARLGVTPVVIEGAGHSPAYDTPNELVGTLREFWSSTGA